MTRDMLDQVCRSSAFHFCRTKTFNFFFTIYGHCDQFGELRCIILKTTIIFSVLSFQNNPKNQDLSYKTYLDLWDCLGMVKLES